MEPNLREPRSNRPGRSSRILGSTSPPVESYWCWWRLVSKSVRSRFGRNKQRRYHDLCRRFVMRKCVGKVTGGSWRLYQCKDRWVVPVLGPSTPRTQSLVRKERILPEDGKGLGLIRFRVHRWVLRIVQGFRRRVSGRSLSPRDGTDIEVRV